MAPARPARVASRPATRLVSVLTPTRAHNADFLDEVAVSVRAQQLPPGWTWEWIVQEDGDEPRLAGRVARLAAGDRRVRYAANGVQRGAPATRRAAFARSRGEVVVGMDHDDRFVAGGLARLLAALAAHPDAGWACGRCVWLQPDGVHTWHKPDVLAAGRQPPGTIARWFADTGDWPFPSAFAAYRREAVTAAGEWPDLPRSDDAALLLAVDADRSGVWVDADVACYRRWPRQKTVDPADWAARETVRAELDRRARAALG